ncbi:hypothetical protein Y032_0623g762 [Ancylostoma ceylanicum]|uniref:Endonuclease/exonuclease/phosphatase domain-containing protein n=1 Tax=Ancylostoma ceylanicum TaxID=53326 RepID=A0A016WKR3_9BILA|nr:hypothetical protein Y032_0623g762 [Ancylostoma ceylanicum]
MNDNGLRLLSFAASNNFMIDNSCFQHSLKHKLTWRSREGVDSAVLDYFLIPCRFRSSFQDIRVIRGADCGSDHYLVLAKVQLRLKKSERKSIALSRRDRTQLADPTCRQKFEIELKDRLQVLAEPLNADEAAEQLADVTTECASTFCPIMQKRTQTWISNVSLGMMNLRKKYKCTDIVRYRELHHVVRRRLKQEQKEDWDNVASEKEYRTLYRTLRRLRGHYKTVAECITKTNGDYVKTAV